MVARGFPIAASGYYSLQKNLYVGIPATPSKKNWHVFSSDDRPCILKVLADNVTVDLNGFVLAASTEHTQGLVLAYVAPGVKNFHTERRPPHDRLAIDRLHPSPLRSRGATVLP
jgi:hypothetical protein